MSPIPSSPGPSDTPAPFWTIPRTVLWTVIALGLLGARGEGFVSSFRPPDGFPSDFLQDWVSARNVQTGYPAYEETWVAYARHVGPAPSVAGVSRNAHPPGSLIAVIPVASLPLETAQLVWNLVTLPLYLVAVGLVLWELNVPLRVPAILPAIAIGIICDPLKLQLQLGNWNCLLGFLLAAAWVADRRGWVGLAGALIGLAAGVKLFPAFLLVYFLATRRSRGVVGFLVAFLALNLLALAILGADAFQIYATQITPVVAAENASSWLNASVVGYWMRIFGPTPSHRILPLADAPALGWVLSTASQVVVLGIVGVVAWRGRNVRGRDRAFAVTTTGMLLVGPLTWPHGLLLLLVPVALLLVRLPEGWPRWALYGCLGVMWLPANYLTQLALGAEQARRMMSDQHDPLSPLQNLASVSVMNYVLLVLFVLTLRLPGGETPNAPQSP